MAIKLNDSKDIFDLWKMAQKYNCDDFHNMLKETRGGKRPFSGAKPKYNETTKTIAFRCPESKIKELKTLIRSKLSEWRLN